MSDQNFWKKCSSCKKEIPFGAAYYLCSVSTCRHKRTGLRFCSVGCWDAHLGYANHRSSYAVEEKAPSREESARLEEEDASSPVPTRDPVKRVVANPISAPVPAPAATLKLPQTDTLVVVSKVKQLIREQSEFNTSECCIDALTRKVVEKCLKGIENARAAGRKTVMGRDIS